MWDKSLCDEHKPIAVVYCSVNLEDWYAAAEGGYWNCTILYIWMIIRLISCTLNAQKNKCV